MSRSHLCLALCASGLASCGARTDLSLLGGSDAASGTLDAAHGGGDGTLPDDGATVDAPVDAPVAAPEASPDSSTRPCNVTTCPQGCCSTDGACVLSGEQQQNACGVQGQACQVCPPGTGCGAGSCWRWQTDCNPTNCPGCCNASMCFITGRGDYDCGRNGQVCQRCAPSDGTGQCVAQDGGGGLCNGVQSCNSTNCLGCCAGDTCVAGNLQDQCGNAGEPCQSCGDLQCGGVSAYGGQCAALDAGACGPGLCPGCCDGVACAYGNQDTACGSDGAVCQDCTSDGMKCVANACQ